MSAVGAVRTATVLGLALHDLVGDARVGDGLAVTARPVGGGRTVSAFATASGAYGFAGLPGMRAAEWPRADEPVTEREFDVTVVDLHGRFLPTVLRVRAPVPGLVTQDHLDLPGASLPTGDPVYLFSAPTRVLPTHLAAVRAQLADAAGVPAAFARLTVTLDAGTAAETRVSGLADVNGAVVVPFPYPRFSGPSAAPGSVPAGTRGEPLDERVWEVLVGVHHEPGVLERPAGLPAPTLGSVLAQRAAGLHATVDGPAQDRLTAVLGYRSDLVLRTAGDPMSRLLVGAAP